MSTALEIGEGDLGKIYNDLLGAAPQWYNLGLHLGLSSDRLDCIKKNNRGVVEDCLREMLKTWLRTSHPTWKSLVDALGSKSVGRNQLAKKMREKYYRAEEPEPVQPLMRRGRTSLVLIILLAIAMLLIVLYYTSSNIVASLRHYNNLQYSKSLPLQPENFVGREEELKNVSSLVDFMSSKTRIVSIIGGPGFGKSALAVSVGHQMLSRGVTVYYVDMTEVSSMQALTEKIIEGDNGIVSIHNITVGRMYKWARQLYYNTLLILDNCDDMLNAYLVKEELQKTIIKLLENSEYLKVLTTSRESTMHFSTFHLKWVPLKELKADASCELLKSYSEQLTATECEKIAYLTGSVPLALKVVGSLLDQPDHPHSPATVIANLEKQLIPTLSPKELPVKERVNACISVSYNYLSPSVRELGQYLAHFPGSFNNKVASSMFSVSSKSDVLSTINELVQRSLLQRNQLPHYSKRPDQEVRYQFHKLIGGFFLEIQRSSNTILKRERDFDDAFKTYFGNLSMELNSLDLNSALEILDQERHNFMHFFQWFCRYHHDFTREHPIGIVKDMFDTNICQYRFTSRELYNPTQCMVDHLHEVCEMIAQPCKECCLSSYISLLLHLARFEEDLNGILEAIKLLETGQSQVEELKTIASGSISYIRFYQRLSIHYKTLKMFDKVRECHEKILYENKKLSTCEPGSCNYLSIGNAYHFLGEYSDATFFFELALKESNLSLLSRASTINNLCTDYDRLQNQQKKEEVLAELVELFPLLIKASNLAIYKHFEEISDIVSLLRTEGRMEEADKLKEKQLTAMKEAGSKPVYDSQFHDNTLTLAKSFYDAGQYSRCVDVAEHSLLAKHEVPIHANLTITMLLLIAEANLHNWNYSGSITFFERAIDYVYEQNQTENYTSEIFLVCPFLMLHGNFRCIYSIPEFVSKRIDYYMFWVYIHVVPPINSFDYLVEDPMVVQQDVAKTTELAEQHFCLIQQSTVTDISCYFQWSYHSISSLYSSFKSMLRFLVRQQTVKTIMKYGFRVILALMYLTVFMAVHVVVSVIDNLVCIWPAHYFYIVYILFFAVISFLGPTSTISAWLIFLVSEIISCIVFKLINVFIFLMVTIVRYSIVCFYDPLFFFCPIT